MINRKTQDAAGSMIAGTVPIDNIPDFATPTPVERRHSRRFSNSDGYGDREPAYDCERVGAHGDGNGRGFL